MGDTSFKDRGPGIPDNSMAELNAHPGVYMAAVINVTWAQLEPTQGSFDFSAIDAALANIGTYNKTYPQHPVVAKLRVWAGDCVPAWLMTLSGGAVTVQGKINPIQIARFWTSPYHGAWLALQQKLAGQYDTDPSIQQVTVTSCACQTFEPFIRPVDSMSRTSMLAAGYSDAADLTCLQNALSDYSAWTQTPLDFPFNPFPHIDSGQVVSETDTPVQLMQAARTALGDRLVLANEGLNVPINPALAPIYAQLQSLGGPIQFQTFNPYVPWDQTIQLGLTYKPTQIEIWDTTAVKGNGAALSLAQLMNYATEIAAD